MAKIIYVEPDEEITNLVDRLRSEKAEKELVFVLPGSSRVLHSALNARLLMQYSNSLGKMSSVVSPDSRSQSVAIDTGFRVFPTMAAYESGGALERPAATDQGVMANVPDDYDQTTRTVRPRRAVGGGAAAAALGHDAAPHTFTRTPRTTATVTAVKELDSKPWLLAGAGIVLAILIIAFVLLPSATVTIVSPARAIAIPDGTVVNGSTAAPSGDLAVQTSLQQAQESSPQQQFTATGTKTIPGAQATGQVTFTNDGFECVSFPKNTQVQTDSGVKFRTTDATPTLGRPSICQGTPKSATVGVSAEQAGVAGNVSSGAINHISETSDPAFTVTNDNPTTGGTDPVNKTVVSQQDLDKAKAQLGDPLVQKVKDELRQKAGKDKYLQETEKVDVSETADHKAGDEAQNFNASVQVSGHVTTVDDAAVKQVLMKALEKQVPRDYQLTNDTPAIIYKVASHDDQGNVSFTTSAAGFMATAIDVAGLQKALAGKSPKDAQTYIRTRVDQVDVRIHLSPSFMPWLPWIGNRIEIRRQVENTHPS